MVTGVEIVSNGDGPGEPPTRMYAPDQIRSVLVRLGMRGEDSGDTKPGYNSRQRDRIRLVERFLLKMERRFYVAEEDFGRLGLAGHPEWNAVYRLLQECRLTKEERRPMSGPRKPLVRLSYPANIIRSGENIEDGRRPEVQRFWRQLLNVS